MHWARTKHQPEHSKGTRNTFLVPLHSDCMHATWLLGGNLSFAFNFVAFGLSLFSFGGRQLAGF